MTAGVDAAPQDERAAWEEAAAAKGIKVKASWSLDRLKTEVAKAA